MKFEVRKRVLNLNAELKVLFDNEEEFEEAMEVIHRLEKRYEMIRLRSLSTVLWVHSESLKTIDAKIENSTHRAAICLFDSYPECKRALQVAQEIELADSTVSNMLTGTFGGAGYMFEKMGSCWRLSEVGLRDVLFELLPLYLQEQTRNDERAT